jgi:hypothetical protein
MVSDNGRVHKLPKALQNLDKPFHTIGLSTALNVVVGIVRTGGMFMWNRTDKTVVMIDCPEMFGVFWPFSSFRFAMDE